jgi:hypothetical protein
MKAHRVWIIESSDKLQAQATGQGAPAAAFTLVQGGIAQTATRVP